MKSNKVFFTHATALSALFILGNALITAPTVSADEFTFLGYLVSVSISFLLYFIAFPVSIFFYKENSQQNNLIIKILKIVFYIAVAIFSLFCIADTFKAFILFIKQIILKNTSLTLIVIVFLAVCLFFASRRQEDILKFCLLCFWFVLGLMLFFFFATMHNYNLRNIFIFRLPEFKNLYNQMLPYIKNPVLPSLLLPIYNVIVFKKNRKGAAFSGLALGSVLLGLGILSATLLFGTTFAGELDFPYSAAVSTVNIGRLFTRLDGFSYFIYFAAAITRITVCIFIMITTLKKLAEVTTKQTSKN